MIAHLVMFRPKPTLTAGERAGLAESITHALREIPTLRRVRVGTRVTHGRGYESMMAANYSHIALLEFDDLAGLKAYLEHPAHGELASRFYASFEETLIYDYELLEGEEGVRQLAGEAGMPDA